MDKILIIEDDRILNMGLQACLKEYGYEVFGSYNGEDILGTIVKNEIDIIVMDVNLPKEDGFRLCKKIKEQKDIPIIFLTAKDEEADVMKGFDLGAEDYITKPFNINIFQKKIAAILKRCKGTAWKGLYCINEFSFDFEKNTVTQNKNIINFTPTEYRILELLISNRGHVLTKEILIDDLWDKNGNFVDEHALAVNISRIRGKIENPEKDMIKTVFGIGYMWRNEDEEF